MQQYQHLPNVHTHQNYIAAVVEKEMWCTVKGSLWTNINSYRPRQPHSHNKNSSNLWRPQNDHQPEASQIKRIEIMEPIKTFEDHVNSTFELCCTTEIQKSHSKRGGSCLSYATLVARLAKEAWCSARL